MTNTTEPVSENEKPGDGELEALVVSRDLSTMVAVDFEGTDKPDRCEWCPNWRFEWVDLEEGHTVLREWHLPDCRVVTEWEETDPEVLTKPLEADER